ncbi:MAG TPA: UDP-2,4-diacetamido-2,4,6-trideoxy-beta-L-altropyranose hydrolase [Desulfobulbaceae bacterium]|nr:UDP-2,4-diacetamido-2,4,6-trideoxy-beta-L-altropyranose hydrolase [Desulfobulbaceae bacterium]
MVIFRVDASTRIGSGHVMRCLTLAEGLRDAGAEVVFITRPHEGHLNSLIQNKDFKLYQLSSGRHDYRVDATRAEYAGWLGTTQEADAAETIEILKGALPEWLIVDHYALDERWEQLVRPYAKKLMVIDDLADRRHDCDLLLDQNYVSGGQPRYTDLVPPSCTTLLGPQFALLRKEFAKARERLKPRDGSVQRIFLFFGGVDPDNMTGKAIEVLSAPEFSHLHADVVIGATNPHRNSIAYAVKRRPRTRLHVQVENIAELMSQADLALCAGGSTTWERCCLGLPSLVVTIAENQVAFTRDLHENGFLRWGGMAESVGIESELLSLLKDAMIRVERNRQESTQGKVLVDGYGSERVSDFLLRGPDPDSLKVRKAGEADCKLFWYWANEPAVRQSAFNSEPILWEPHHDWFRRKLADADTRLYVIDSDMGPVGQVRFEKEDDGYLISYSIGRQYRGHSLGCRVLDISIKALKSEQPLSLIAEVKEENIASSRIFEKLGFTEYPGLRSGAKFYRLSLNN